MFKTHISLLLFALLFSVGAVSGKQLDDPTRPPGYPLFLPGGKGADMKPSWRVSAIYITESSRKARVNGRMVTIGDQVAGAKVAKIFPGEVHMRTNNRQFIVRLVNTNVKKQMKLTY